MKNKPQRHKESNVFRFKTFSDRINEIDLRRSALYHIKHANEEAAKDVPETEFHQTYCKWTVLNLSEEYNAFQRKVSAIVTLPQLIHKRDFVVETVLNALAKGTALSLQPILEFVVALARDLREEFYPYFQPIITKLVSLLSTKEPDPLEWTLICLAHLFKILKPFLKKDITIVFNTVIPLLDNRNPEHITNFAAECFSFVARDIKDKEKFLSLMLNSLRSHKNGINGCGRLLVEIVRGVNGQFHSCAELFLRTCFASLATVKASEQTTLNEVLTEMITQLLQCIQPRNMQIFWTICYETLDQFLKESPAKNEAVLNILLVRMGQTLETRDGKFLTDVSELVTVLIKVIDTAQISDECLKSASQMAAILLLSSNLMVTQLDASRISKKVLTIPSSTIFEQFVWNCVNYTQFKVLILPEFLRYLDGKHFNVESLELFAKIVLAKSPLCRSGLSLGDKTLYSIRLRSQQCLEKIENIILEADEQSWRDPRELLSAVIVYPHLIGASFKRVKDKLTNLIELGLQTLKPESTEATHKQNRKMIYILSILIENYIHLRSSTEVASQEKNSYFEKALASLLPLCRCDDFNYVPALRLFDLIVTSEAKQSSDTSNQITLEVFIQIHELIASNLASRYHEIRLLTAHIFSQFAKELKLTDTIYEIYDTFVTIESIEPTVQSYREQLLHLQRIEASTRLLQTLTKVHEACKLDPLRYLLGCLHVNFRLLWKPIMDLVTAFFEKLELEDFWSIFKQQLEETTARLHSAKSSTGIDVESDNFLKEDSYLASDYAKIWICDERDVDLVNYRIQLWQMIPSFGSLSEIKNREIVTIFLNFIEREYKKSTDCDSFTWNILKKDGEPDRDEEEDRDDDDEPETKNSVPKGTQRTLTTMLQVFTKQANPKQLHRESEISALYMQLLSHRNATVQKLALDCIVAYKHKFVQPYKEYLYNIIDDAKFKEGITQFKINKEDGIVQPEHRPQLMPIVMRILFSKMSIRAGGQKGTNQLRKSLVMRFLGGCHEDEILIMLNMSFWLLEANFEKDAKTMCCKVVAKTDLSNVLSPRKLQSSLDLIDVIQGEFSGLMSEKFLRYILNLLLVIGSISQGVLEQNERRGSATSAKMANTYKSLRNTSLQILQRFFNHFDSYAWSDNEIDAIFYTFVSPLAKTMPDNVSTVSPLLKLFATFAKIPRLFVLLTRYTRTDTEVDSTPLKLMMDVLVDQKAAPLVCLTIMETIQNLLTLNDVVHDMDSEQMAPPPLNISNCRPIDMARLKDISQTASLNYGSKILLPYLPKILEKFKINLRKRRGLTKRDVFILSKITELITDAETCNTLLTVLLPILVRKSHSNAGEVALSQMVSTIANLLKTIDRPERHIRSVAPLFEQIVAIGPRKQLCELLQLIANRCKKATEKKKNVETMVSVVNELNAWDKRWVEQPDYERRLNAYKQISQLMLEKKIDIDFGLLIIYNSFHFIKYDKDMALRDSAAHHLKTLVPELIHHHQSEQPKEVEYLIGTVILNLVRRTIRDRNENVRTEGILLLGEMARECPDAHPVLSDLHPLTSKQDREIDFFDNVTHLQSLRHGRALLRFCTIAKTYEKAPNPRTLTQFILPLASMYVASEKYASKHGIVTSAIETIGAVCRLLPWHQYESILKYYLKCMRFNVEHQKQMVRIVMQILDAFHFDLSKANIAPNEMPKPSETDTVEDVVNDKEVKTEEPSEVTKQEEGEEDIVIEDKESDDEKFDDELDAINKDDAEIEDIAEEEEIPCKKSKVCAFDRSIVLSHSIAKKLIHNIVTGLIPTLNHSITALSTFESFHKLNKKKRRSEREEEEILRVPIALAMVKLLQKLPQGMLEQNISGILLKVCMFLRSPLVSVRMTTRDVLKNIMLTIGASHLETLLNHMTTMLTRGFQVHVLTITVHCILDAIKSALKNGIMDKCLQHVLDVCLQDIFGQRGEEKEVSKIGKHTPEAKPHNKSFLTLSICANNITESCLLDLLMPFKEQLLKSQSKKVVTRVQECFQKIVTGLIVNKQISIESMLIFIYGIISESIPDLLPDTKQPVLSENEKARIKRARPDSLLLPEDPTSNSRTGVVKKTVVTNVRANAHVLIEFGLELLQMTLKRGKLLKINYQPFIDPIIPILHESLSSANVRVTTFSLKCLSTILSKEMTSSKLDNLTASIVDKIFLILHKYVAANTDMSSDNFNLVQSAFKTIVNILRHVSPTTFDIKADDLKTLLFYIEQYLNVNETTKQTISFSLLKVILSRRLVISELNNVLMQVARLAIQSESDTARAESKGIIVNYLMDYHLGKKIDGFVEFFVSNLNYDVKPGRESAINILHSIAKRFPQKYLNRKCGLLFVALGSRLINDEAAECRQQIADCIETLLTRIDVNHRDELFTVMLTLLKDEKKSTHREMGALLCTRFINVEKQKFESRIENVLPVLLSALLLAQGGGSAGKFVKIQNDESDADEEAEDEDSKEARQRAIDHQIIQVQNTILKIFTAYTDIMTKHPQYVDELAYESQKLLAYDHVWVRLNALKLLQIILQNIDSDQIVKTLKTGEAANTKLDYLYGNPEEEIKSLTLDLCAQLIPEQTDSEVAEAVTTNLLFVANILKDVPFRKRANEEDADDEDVQTAETTEKLNVNLTWLLRRLRFVIHAEVAKAPHSIVLRSAVFGWIEGLVELLPEDSVNKLAHTLLLPLVREMSDIDQNIDARLRKIAIRVGEAIRTRIGDDDYNILRAQIQKKLMIRRAERKKSIAIEKISDPVKAARRMQGIKERKKAAKRKNMDAIRGKIASTKKRFRRDDDSY